ncbi:hypothetical protein ABBQ32_005004 [Trebouxia sp. C0010 RCD-2024]
MAEGVQQFGNIFLGSRGGTSQGQLKITTAGLYWKKTGGGAGKTVEVPLKDIDKFIWTKVARGCQLGVKGRSGATTNFTGFRDQDLEQLRQVGDKCDKPIEEKELSMSGRNWGDAVIDGSTLVFNVAGKPAFRIPLTDVGQVQKGRDDVMLEFPADDTAGGDHEDALCEMSFHVPKESDRFGGEDTVSAAEVLHDQIVQFTDAGAATGNAVVTFEKDSLSLLAPRGRFDVEMYLSSLKLTGQAQDYRIQYDSIVRLFVLPKSNVPQTLVVISLDPPIRKGQTYYPHILCQFNNDDELNIELDITEEQLEAKNEKCHGKLQQSLSGSAVDVFSKTLRGLAATKLTKPSAFRTADGVGYAVRCSYKADDGYLYPLERAFFYVQKPPTLLVHDEIESVEFLRQGGTGMLASSAKTFDLSIRMQSSDQEYQFRGIQKAEWNNLFSFIKAKRLRIENVDEVEMGPSGAARPGLDIDLGEDIDTGMASIRANAEDEDSEEDADFDMKSEEDDGGEPSDDSEAESGDAEMIEEQPKKKAKHKAPPTPDSSQDKPAKKSKAKPKAKSEDAEENGGAKAKKPRKKKDKDEPKKGLSAFMFFSQANREKVKSENPGIAFTDVARVLGEKWKNIDPGEKAEFEEQAAKDKLRYQQQMADYKAKKAEAAADSD